MLPATIAGKVSNKFAVNIVSFLTNLTSKSRDGGIVPVTPCELGLLFLSLLLLLRMSGTVSAVEVWTGANDTNFNDNANWSDNSKPVTNDDVQLPDTGMIGVAETHTLTMDLDPNPYGSMVVTDIDS